MTASLRILHTSLRCTLSAKVIQNEANLPDDASSPILEKFATCDGEGLS